MPFVITISAVLTSFDSYFYIIQCLSDTYGYNLVVLSILHCIRFSLLSIAAYEICRLLCLISLMLVYMLITVGDIYSNLIGNIGLHLDLNTFKNLIFTYSATYISNKCYAPFQELGTLLGISYGIFIASIGNFVTVKAYDVLPLPIYFIFPAISGATLFFVNLTLPYGHGLHEMTVAFLKRCGTSAGIRGGIVGKYMRCKLRGMRPLLFYSGFGGIRLFTYDRDQRMDYFEAVIGVTLTLLLGVPELYG